MTTARVSKSYLDPILCAWVPRLYSCLPIPRRLAPEAIVAFGHLIAILGAAGFAFAGRSPWWALIAALGVVMNHLSDMVDGTHARSTGQCRNGGELLDHFLDPLSFSYWMIGIGIAADRPYLAIAAVLSIQAQALLTSIRAKMTGEFRLSRVGPTEFKATLVVFALGVAVAGAFVPAAIGSMCVWFLGTLAALGVGSTIVQVGLSVRDVNRRGGAPDETEWQVRELAR